MRFGMKVRQRSGSESLPLPGGHEVARNAARTDARLRRRYGSRAAELADIAARTPSSYEPLEPGVPDIRAEASFAAAGEMACRIEDVLRRRTQVALTAMDGGARAAGVTGDLMGEQLGWDRAKREQRIREYLDECAEPEPHWRRRA
jgi:glycerol-3-phosphate dehydrogenase